MSKILFVGCGKMGFAMLSGVAKSRTEIVVVDPAPHEKIKAFPSVSCLASPKDIPSSFQPDVIVLAVKPQQMEAVLPDYARYRTSVFLSVAAGKDLQTLASLLDNDEQPIVKRPIVRAMPNLPASIGKGASVAVANPFVTKAQCALCEKILHAIGTFAWIQDENLMDAVTALSGSGPAYVFALVEAMATAGEKLGLPRDLAQNLARQTLIGSGALLEQREESAEDLRRAVTSPGGTTEAALDQLLAEEGLFQLMTRTLQAAEQRGKDLAGKKTS